MLASSQSKPLHLGISWNHSLCPESSKDSWDSKFVPLSWHKLSDKTAKIWVKYVTLVPEVDLVLGKWTQQTNGWNGVPMPYFQTKLYIYPIYYFHTPCISCVGPRYVYHMGPYVSQCWTQRWGVKTLWRFVRRKNWRCWPTSIRWVWSLNGGQNEEKPRLGVETALRMVGFPCELVKLHNYIFSSDH